VFFRVLLVSFSLFRPGVARALLILIGLYISNVALKALLFKILGDYRVRIRDSYIKGKL
jgi:hypothetical protein